MQVGGVTTDPFLPGAIFDLDSWTSPGDFYSYTAKSAMLSPMHLRVVNSIDPTDLVAEEKMVTSYDGVKVPLTILYKRGFVKVGNAPTALIGYGAYSDAFLPGFSRRYMVWVERGGVLAVAHVRGGGEFGESWHLAGKGLTKPNTWRDFIASAEYLIANKYTSSAKLGIWSQSAGGILIVHGAARPLRCSGGWRPVLGHATRGDRPQRPRKHTGVWHGKAAVRL